MKLKSLLNEFAWDRKHGKPLPTLEDVQKAYQEKQSKQNTLTEGIYVGQTVKVITKGMTHYNEVGEVVEEASSGKFFTVEFPKTNELAYFHMSDLKAVYPND